MSYIIYVLCSIWINVWDPLNPLRNESYSTWCAVSSIIRREQAIGAAQSCMPLIDLRQRRRERESQKKKGHPPSSISMPKDRFDAAGLSQYCLHLPIHLTQSILVLHNNLQQTLSTIAPIGILC